MGRYRRRRTYQRRERKPLIWEPLRLGTPINPDGSQNPQNVAAETIYKIADLGLNQNADQEVILERIRGNMFWQVTASSGATIQGTIFAVILPDIVAGNVPIGNALPNFPDPYDVNGTDDFPMVIDACAPVGGGITSTVPIEVDVKAKRRMNKDELLTFALKVDSLITTGVQTSFKAYVRGGIRCLQKIL